MPLQISTLKFWINLEPLDYFRLIGTARGGRSAANAVELIEMSATDNMAIKFCIAVL
jgi:hypothetical protein